jgi:L-amino acid N-acyltransferase YncA
MIANNDDIRSVTPQDAEEILQIYKPFVTDTVISFEVTSPSVQEMEQRIHHVTHEKKFPYIVYTRNSKVVGYAYAHSYRDRIAYQWGVETSVYVSSGYHRQGIGRKLYEKLLETLKSLGYYNAFAGITLPNDASAKLHEAMGFQLFGVAKRAGYKFGGWHDVGFYQLVLKEPIDHRQPDEPLKFEHLN